MILTENAMRIFYYLMAVDGEVSSVERETFTEMGSALKIPDTETLDDIAGQCKTNLQNISKEDRYDIISENVDRVLYDVTNDSDEGISSRLLIWDMLAIAYSDRNYSLEEEKLIKHVARVLDLNESIYLEMEHMIKTIVAIKKELEWLEGTNGEYLKIHAEVEELRNRISVIIQAAVALIDDENFSSIEKLEIHKTKAEVVIENAFHKTGKQVKNAASVTGDKVKTAAGSVGTKTKDILTGFKTKRKKGE